MKSVVESRRIKQSSRSVFSSKSYLNVKVRLLINFKLWTLPILILKHSLSFFFPMHLSQLSYVLSIEYDTHQGALLPPQLNIPAKGMVPDKVETFTVHLPCSGTAEVPLAINLYVKVRVLFK